MCNCYGKTELISVCVVRVNKNQLIIKGVRIQMDRTSQEGQIRQQILVTTPLYSSHFKSIHQDLLIYGICTKLNSMHRTCLFEIYRTRAYLKVHKWRHVDHRQCQYKTRCR